VLVVVSLTAALLGVGLAIFAFEQRRDALAKRELALQSANIAATAEALAQQQALLAQQQATLAQQQEALAHQNASLAQNRALISGANAEYYKGNLIGRRHLATDRECQQLIAPELLDAHRSAPPSAGAVE
jgi:uncharacterized protein HemX